MSDGGIKLVLDGPAEVSVGQPVDLRVQIHNASDHSIWMVGVVDGSEGGVRFPRYAPEVKFDGQVVAAPPPQEDPLVGPLRVRGLPPAGPRRIL